MLKTTSDKPDVENNIRCPDLFLRKDQIPLSSFEDKINLMLKTTSDALTFLKKSQINLML
jgi:hypothetical protein